MIRYVERYWATITGFSMAAACVVVGVAVVGSRTVDSIVRSSLEERGERFAQILGTRREAADALLTGLSRKPDQETEIRNLATLGGIESFAVFARDGRETFRSRSDKYAWLLRDRAGGITSQSRISDAILGRTPPFRIVGDEDNGYVSVLTPILRDGVAIGYVSIVANPARERERHAITLAGASLKVLFILFVATGAPILVYIKRKHKIAEASARIEFLANHDPLTRLLNRRRMQDEVEKIIAMSRVTRADLHYLCIDIDGLSEINDTLGQAQGDELLRIVANRLASVVDGSDLLARIAADDFAVFSRRSGGGEDIASFARRLRSAVAEPVELKDQIIRPQISIGIARLPRDGRTQNELVKHAQLALAHHKSSRSGDYVAFEPFMDEETDRRRHIETLVRSAVANNSFELAYQPLVTGDGTRLVGFEALLRMRDEEGTYISPAIFVPIAETRGLIKEIGTWVIREAVRQAALWPDHITVSVNLSAVQFRDGDLVQIVDEALKSAGIKGDRIEMEIVESLLLERTDSIISQLRDLKNLGISIAMDDFGTGYSSLGYLWKFPFDKLKIDRSFMVALEEGEANVAQIVSTIISLAHLMHMKVTTEGVETAEQAELLDTLGCDILQGYHFGKPMPAGNVATEVLSRFAERTTQIVPEAMRNPISTIA